MIREIHKRPFARPLLLWITGVVLQTYGSFRALSFVLLLPPALFLLLPLCLCRKQKPALAYENRWVWGALFSCLLLFLSIQLTAYHETRSPPPSSHQWARHIQQTLTASFDSLQLTEEERAVLSTITLGDRSHISREVRQQFSLTGVAHILSVSGFHVAIVCGFLFRLLSFFPANNAGRWIRYLLTLLSLWLFVDISGMAVASIRAGIMLSLYLTAKHLGRKTDGYNTLAASAFCMFVYDPF
jgi:competence protein ComEC